MKLSVCIPMYNESAICAETLLTLAEEATRLKAKGYPCELVFFDDGSADRSGELLRREVEEWGYTDVKVLIGKKNLGKGAAVREAVLHTEGDIVVYTDCDLAYGTEPILRAAKMIEAGEADAVLGSRNLKKDSYGEYTAIRRLASKVYIKVISVAAGFRMSDSQCGFKAYRGDLARRIFALCTVNGFAFDLEAIKIGQKMGVRFAEMPVKIINHRDSKIRLVRDTLKMLSDIRVIKKKVKALKI